VARPEVGEASAQLRELLLPSPDVESRRMRSRARNRRRRRLLRRQERGDERGSRERTLQKTGSPSSFSFGATPSAFRIVARASAIPGLFFFENGRFAKKIPGTS